MHNANSERLSERRQQERGFMHKTRRLMDEDSVFFQMFLILLSFIKFCIRKQNFCVQAMSEQYLDVCCCCFFVRGEGGSMRRTKIWRFFQ